MVFSEFIEMVEEVFGFELADRIITETDLPSGGAYTSVGTYDHAEMLALVERLSELTGTPVAELVRSFGRHLCGRFTQLYRSFFEGVDGCFSFLETIEHHVHVEVRKLYPDAELPNFETQRPGPDTLLMTYSSKRPFAPLAHGLILGCIDYFEERISVEVEDLSADRGTGAGTCARFTLQRQTD
ncbi:MAG: heme NO-binding domain-containing protein [Gammaproteobacteria bacterium]|nr:heme NO-binding domain-containing protein [Gammaproteobacteria bacterium]